MGLINDVTANYAAATRSSLTKDLAHVLPDFFSPTFRLARPAFITVAILYSRLTVLCRLMDSAFARYYRTLGQFYRSRLVHGSLSPGLGPINGSANSVFIDNGPRQSRGEKYQARKFA